MDISLIVSVVLLSLVATIVMFSVLRGLIRGWKKSLFAFCWLLGLVVILLIFSSLITKGVANVSLSFLGFELEGVSINNFSDLGTALLQNVEASDMVVAGELIASIPLMIANVLVFTILFWALRLLTWPIYAIISAIVFRKDRKAKKEWKKAGKPDRPVINGEVMPQKPNVKRGFGALIGVASGLLICFVTLMPIMGVNGYINEVKNIKISTELAQKISPETTMAVKDGAGLYAETEDKVSLVSLYLDEDVMGYLNVYEDSAVGTAFKYIGLNKLGELTFNGLARATVGGETISLKHELNTILQVYEKAEVLIIKYDLLNANKETFKNLNQQELSEIIDTSRAILNSAFESKFVSVVLNNYFGDIVEITANKFLDEKIENDVDNFILKEVCKLSIDYLIEIGNKHEVSKFIYKEIDNLLQVAQTINNYNLLNPIINNNYSKVLLTTTANLQQDLVKDFKEFVDYMNVQESEVYEKNKYISSLSADFTKTLFNCSLLKDLLPELEEGSVRTLYKQLLGETKYNNEFSSYYLNGEDDFNKNVAIEELGDVNVQIVETVLNFILNMGYNYDEVNDLITTIKNGGEDSIKNIATKIEESDILEGFLQDIGSLIDIVVQGDAFSPNVEKDLIDYGFNKIKNSIKNTYKYDTLESTDPNKKLCETLINVVDNVATNVKTGNSKKLMSTLATSINSAFKAMDQIEELTNIKEITPEELEDLSISDISKSLQDLTSGETPLITNKDIADILDTTFDSIMGGQDIANSILDKKLDESDENSKTISETLIDNIANNEELNWETEGEIVEDVAKKAIELTNKTDGDTADLVEEIKGLLNDLGTKDEDGNFTTSTSQILTPDLLNYFQSYLNENFGQPSAN